MAYDKRNQHDKADAVYKKLITHPEFANGLQAGIARQILELDTALRTGEVPKIHNAWIGQTAPNFQIEKEDTRGNKTTYIIIGERWCCFIMAQRTRQV